MLKEKTRFVIGPELQTAGRDVSDTYYPVFLVDKVRDELQKVIDLLESGETDTEVTEKRWIRRSAASMIFRMNFYENDSEIGNGGPGLYWRHRCLHSGVVRYPD